ncbi:MAG: TlpA family protein disulfide reductase [Chloroflexota bacterium]|nr:TlpA family protein disulfide reductase [Chloroflexota bacterium]
MPPVSGPVTGRHRPAALAVLLVVMALLVGACSDGGSAAQEKGYVSGDGVIEQIPVADRTELPSITGRLLDGGRYDSRAHRGEVVVYNVWGSWCVPCREEAPVLRRVSQETRDRGVRFVGINVRDNDASARAFERRYDIPYPSIVTADSAGALLAFGSKLPPNAVPSTMIVDREGRIAARIIGKTTYGTLTSLIEDTLAER